MATNRGKHEGSIFKTPGGKWRAQYSAPNGHRFSETFVTKEEAKQWLIEQRSNQNHGFDFKGSMVTLREYLEKWLETSCTSLREKTTLNYKRMVLRYIVPHLGNMSLKDLDLATIEWFYGPYEKQEDPKYNSTVIMNPDKGSSADGNYKYIGYIKCEESGLIGYTIRILPKNSLFIHPYELGVVYWA